MVSANGASGPIWCALHPICSPASCRPTCARPTVCPTVISTDYLAAPYPPAPPASCRPPLPPRLAAVVGSQHERIVAVADPLVGPVQLLLKLFVRCELLDWPPAADHRQRQWRQRLFSCPLPSESWPRAAASVHRRRQPTFQTTVALLREVWRRRRSRQYLITFDDRTLRDIGVTGG
jgi:uncharacterized protein YjiS (DUF1127 family)